MSAIKPSARLSRVRRVFDPYQDRKAFVRLDRNEDPVGWSGEHFETLRRNLTAYDLAAYADSTELVEKLSRWLEVSPDSVLITAGSDAAMKTIFETYVDADDAVLMQDPSWRMYEVYNNIYQGKALLIPYDRNLGFDVGAVLRSMREQRIRLVVLANPNQPTGTLMDDADVESVIAAGAASGTVVVMDEAYYLYTERTALGLVARYPNLIIARTFSKAFGLAGLRLGYVVAQPERISELMLLRPVTDSNSIALKCGEYALDHLDWIRTRIADFVAGRQYLYERMVAAGLETFPSHTNFVLVRCPTAEHGREMIAQARTRKYLLKGPWTAAPLENCVRVSIGPRELMHRFWTECGEIVTRHASRRAPS
jgi:histidinol-phosphate aminotransferase